MAFNLQMVLQALLFSTNRPLTAKDIQEAFTRFHAAGAAETEADDAVAENDGAAPDAASETGASEPIAGAGGMDGLYDDVPSLVTAAQIREAMAVLAEKLRSGDAGLLLVEGANGYRLVTHPRLARWIRSLRNEPPPLRLSPSVLETLAVVAYRQPATRAEIEAVRGVSAEAGISKLLERELVYVVGRADQPGRPMQYGTTDQFLELVGVKSVDELPASDVLSQRQVDDWLQAAMQPAKVPTEAEMGLPLENGATDTGGAAPEHPPEEPAAAEPAAMGAANSQTA